MAKAKQQTRVKKHPPRKAVRKTKRATSFGPVTTINTAPVAIGNSVRGSKPQVTNSANGCRVIGRDFAFEAKATVAAANNWNLIGGMPITPAVLATSSLRSYAQMFSNFRVNRLVVHYITSSPTSQAGDILFYYERERNSPMIDFTNNSFLPFVLSDPNTVIGPQWQNHSVMIDPVREWKNTNYGLNTDLNEESVGSVFLFSKTNAASSPGYILIDFDITFKDMCVNPRAGILPITRGLWNYVTLQALGTMTLGGSALFTTGGVNPDGTPSSAPNGAAPGDIYKMIVSMTASTVSGTNPAWSTVTPATLFQATNSPGTASPAIIDDGFTLYARYTGTYWFCFPSLEGAKTKTNEYQWATSVALPNVAICTLASVVGFSSGALQSSY